MPFPTPIERPGIFSLSGPEKWMNQAANKWKNSVMPQPLVFIDSDLPSPSLETHSVHPLPIPSSLHQKPPIPQTPAQPPIVPDSAPPSQEIQAFEIPTMPISASLHENSPVPLTPEPPSAIPTASPQQNAAISENKLASVVPLAKQALKLLQNRRILGGFFFLGLLAMGYFLKNETIRNVNISVEADPRKKRTYRILLDQGNTKIRLGLTPGKPVDIQLNRPVSKEPTVYNIVIEAPDTKKKAISEEHIDLGDRQVVRLVDKR